MQSFTMPHYISDGCNEELALTLLLYAVEGFCKFSAKTARIQVYNSIISHGKETSLQSIKIFWLTAAIKNLMAVWYYYITIIFL